MSLQDKIKNAEETMWPMTMGMSISEAISKMRYELNKNNKIANAYAVAIDTMQKYQKIEEIMHKVYTSDNVDVCLVQRLAEIREVIEDGSN